MRTSLQALVAVLATSSWLSFAQNTGGTRPGPPSGAAGPRYTVSGIVVNAVSGEPIPRALVQLLSESPRMSLTGPDGRFRFEGVPGGAVTASAEKPGYFNGQQTRFEQAAEPYQMFQVNADSGDLRLSLLPSSSIAGRITETTGEPIDHIQVHTLYRRVQGGRVRWEQLNSGGTTDDDGSYVIGDLLPGSYLVITESRSVNPFISWQNRGDKPFDEVYPAVYFPGAPDMSSAALVQVRPGDQQQADITLPIQRAYRISGTFTPPSPAGLSLTLLGQDSRPFDIPVVIDQKKNTFTLVNILPGRYMLNGVTLSDQKALYSETPIEIGTHDVANISVELNPFITLPVEITSDSSSALNPVPTFVQLHLTAVDNRSLGADIWSRTEDREGRTVEVIPNVTPGRYHVSAEQTTTAYVASLRADQSDLTQEDLVIVPGQQPPTVHVSLHSGAATIHGKLLSGDSPATGYLLVIRDPIAAEDPRVVHTNGSFEVTGLAPGTYRLYAFPSTAGLEYQNPAAMQKFSNSASMVTLGENENKQVDVQLIQGGAL